MRALYPHFEKLSLIMPAGCLDQEYLLKQELTQNLPGTGHRLRVPPLGCTFAKHKLLSFWCGSPFLWLDSKYPRILELQGHLSIREASQAPAEGSSGAWNPF